MAVWVIRAGDSGVDEYAASFFRDGLVIISFGLRRPLCEFTSQAELRSYIQDDPRNNKQAPGAASSAARQLWDFAHHIALGDLIMTPLTKSGQIAVGRITGECFHHTAEPNIGTGPADRFHARRVEWRATDIPAQKIDRAWRSQRPTIFQPSQVDNAYAQAHIEQVVREHLGIAG